MKLQKKRKFRARPRPRPRPAPAPAPAPPRPRLLKLARAGRSCSMLSGATTLSLTAAALALSSTAMVVIAAAMGMAAVAALSTVDTVFARDDLFPPSACLIVALCPARLQCLCLRHIFLRLDWLERGTLYAWCTGRDNPGHQHRQKFWQKPLLFLRRQECLSAFPHDALWLLA